MKRKNLITLIVVILVIIALVAISLGANTTRPSYCNEANVISVSTCTDGSYKVVSGLLGGGYTIYKPDGSSFQCPVVGPEYITQECQDYMAMCNDINIC